MGKDTEKQIEKELHPNDVDEHLSDESQSPSDNQGSQSHMQSLSDQDDSEQMSSSSSPVEAAIKTMNFRANRGSKMKDLIKGNIKHDAFWQRHCSLFGGDLRLKEDDDDEEDYQQSSSGRDQFDSDFNNTDSYPGKRGRKKGTKIKKRKLESGRKRGRPKKVVVEKSESSEEEEQRVQRPKRSHKKVQTKKQIIEDHKHKIIYKRAPEKPEDYFIIMKATIPSKRGRKPKALKANQNMEGSKQEE